MMIENMLVPPFVNLEDMVANAVAHRDVTIEKRTDILALFVTAIEDIVVIAVTHYDVTIEKRTDILALFVAMIEDMVAIPVAHHDVTVEVILALPTATSEKTVTDAVARLFENIRRKDNGLPVHLVSNAVHLLTDVFHAGYRRRT